MPSDRASTKSTNAQKQPSEAGIAQNLSHLVSVNTVPKCHKAELGLLRPFSTSKSIR
jgi:hypothetical protein